MCRVNRIERLGRKGVSSLTGENDSRAAVALESRGQVDFGRAQGGDQTEEHAGRDGDERSEAQDALVEADVEIERDVERQYRYCADERVESPAREQQAREAAG